MAEVKNSFLKSRMNKDLDDRLIPNGEYRDAFNISVGKSEQNDVGALQNVLGNSKLPLSNETNTDLVCIGYYVDEQNNRIIQFLTDYNDPNPSAITLPDDSYEMKITMYDFNNSTYSTLVSGTFLNFANNKDFLITGINLIEGLLFWTDNRNQPRKINVETAYDNPLYYTNETHISVAKYAPVSPILLYNKYKLEVINVVSTTEIEFSDASNISVGMWVVSDNIPASEYIVVSEVDGNTVYLYSEPSINIVDGDVLTFFKQGMSDKSSIDSWPGDPDFLEDKYVRFSYRFKYDDNEYSIMAPFTQIAYIPKQKGYFIAGDETDAYRSTVVKWFENNVNNIELLIPLPDKGQNILSTYKIKEIDILYKESDSNIVSVIETVETNDIISIASNTNYLLQEYKSQKPYKTLPNDQVTRVYDRVPVLARAQDSAGNRIIYGNYFDRYTAPSRVNYNVSVQSKSDLYDNFVEYPNHTLKRNRNYQVGFVLADKYGRQSSVILSSLDITSSSLNGLYTKGSTVYSDYDNNLTFNSVKEWFGDALFVSVNEPLSSVRDISAGTPGLYAEVVNPLGFAIQSSNITGNVYTVDLDPAFPSSNIIPDVGQYLRGEYTDYVIIENVIELGLNQYEIYTSDVISSIYNYEDLGPGVPSLKFSYNINPIGWYSYKIVVRQPDQDYYNVYLPGMLKGYPVNQTFGSQVIYDSGTPSLENSINTTVFPTVDVNNISHIVLINDNINKVPRDLSEVGPDQKQYRSSVQLYGRVQNSSNTVPIEGLTPSFSAKLTTIEYDPSLAGNDKFGLIKPGDGIQCDQANYPIPGPTGFGDLPNPYAWSANTVVVSNEIISPTLAVITISPPNWVLGGSSNPDPNGFSYTRFTITRAENIQYFPTRKADTVTSIANAIDFNFLDNDVNNNKGSAGLNLYQIQTNPLIGRVSTVNGIGVVGSDMVPFLSVYETRPQESILDLFWETSTSGLISDLNYDVLTGYDGPVGFDGFDYVHFEDQDPDGSGIVEGVANSKYVSTEFSPINTSGLLLTNTEATLLDIIDGDGISRFTEFGIETIGVNPAPVTYRLFIKDTFNFNHDAFDKEVYTFKIKVKDNDSNKTNELNLNGRLGNITPEITTSVLTYFINQDTQSIVTLLGNNGSKDSNNTNLYWEITDTDAPANTFELNPITGVLSLINDTAPIGSYFVEVKLTDAVDPLTGDWLTNVNPDFASKSTSEILTINIGPSPVDYWSRPIFENSSISITSDGNENTRYEYGLFYIGNKDIDLLSGGDYVNRPSSPVVAKDYDFVRNVQIDNSGDTMPLEAGGLTQGSLKWTIELSINATIPSDPPPPPDPNVWDVDARADVILYYRDRTNPASSWQAVRDDNYVGPDHDDWTDGVDNKLSFTIGFVEGEYIRSKKIVLTCTNPTTAAGEWALAVRLTDDSYLPVSNGTSMITVKCEDANYTYIDPDYDTPIITPYSYFTGVEYLGESFGVPRSTQDASPKLLLNSTNNVIDSGSTDGSISAFECVLENENVNLTPGLKYQLFNPSNSLVNSGDVAAINIDGNAKKVLLQPSPSAPPLIPNLENYKLTFSTLNVNESIGELFANTEDGINVKQFFIDSALSTPWFPPIANAYYIMRSDKSYSNNNTIVSEDAYFIFRIDENGTVIEAINSNTVQTNYEIDGDANNYYRNLEYNQTS
jgi:hypothetical protein